MNPKSLVKELAYLKENNVATDNLRISDRAHVILPYHIKLINCKKMRKVKTRLGQRLKELAQPTWIKQHGWESVSLIY